MKYPTPSYNLKVPCKNCERRTVEPVNCHTVCEEYLHYKEELEKIKTNRKMNDITRSYHKESFAKKEHYLCMKKKGRV